MAVWRNVHRVHNLTESCEASAHLSIRVRSYLLHPASSLNQPSVQPPMNASTPIPRCVVGECALLIPLSQLSQKAGSLSDAEGEEGCLAELPPAEGGNGELTRPDPKPQESTGAINCRGSAGSQCPLCRWGISCWWPATGPHTPGGRGACRVISCRHRRDTVRVLK